MAVVAETRERVRRRLAAILVAGLSRLFPGEEKDNFAGLRAFLTDVIDPLIPEFDGNIFKHTGDLVLIEFDSVVEATRCAAALRDAVAPAQSAVPNEQRLAMRIGINLGDIIAEGGDVFGDGVNIAARLEALAEPGSIFVSEMAYHHVADKLDYDFEDLGPHNLKNIRRPVRVYRMGGRSRIAGRPRRSRRGRARSRQRAPSGFDDRRAIAVLPFANFSGDPEQEFFADGITEDIITMLAGWRAFPVIARNSTFTYKGKTVDIKKVGEELGVRYVLEGSVRKSGRRVRVTAQLIRADTNHHIMAERYDRDLTDLFELQDEIVRTIAGAIEPELLKFERERIAERPQHNEDAYEFYQRGMWHHYRHSKADNVEAQDLFPACSGDRSALSAGDSGVGDCRLQCGLSRLGRESPSGITRKLGAWRSARSLSTPAIRTPISRSVSSACGRSRSDQAMASIQEAIKLNPSFAAAHVLLGHMLPLCRAPGGGDRLAEKCIRLSPNDPRLFIWLPALAGAHYQLRNYEKAIEIGRRAWSLNRNWPAGLRYVVAGLGQLGRMDEARAALTT